MICESPPPESLKRQAVLRAARRGYSIAYKNKTLLSAVDPVMRAEQTAASAVKADRTLYFCPSPLLGYGLDVLFSAINASAGSAVLCVETEPELYDLSLHSPHSMLCADNAILSHPRFAFTAINDGAELCRFVRKTWGSRAFRRLEIVKLSGGWQLDKGYETMAELLCREIAVDWGNAMTLVKLGRRFIRNTLHNLPKLNHAKPLTELSFGAKPILVLGAGPSLDGLLDELARSGGRGAARRPFAVICADTCLSLLGERGIVPDLVIILESQHWNLRDFTGFKDSGIPAAMDLSAYPSGGTILNGPAYFFFTPWTPLRIFERMQTAGILPPAIPPLGSVGLAAVELARRLGSGPVIAAGVDFSFTPDKTHARSSPAHLASLAAHTRYKSLFNAGAVFQNGTFTALSKSNIPVRSNPSLRTYRNLFEQEFKDDPRIRDVAGTGLPLGVKTLSVDEAVDTLLKGGLHGGAEPGTERNIAAASGAGFSAFITQERSMLEELRNLLTGDSVGDAGRLESLLDAADYLWAHFPDCAGTEGRRPPLSDMVFLKRVRVEIDPFITLWKRTEREAINA